MPRRRAYRAHRRALFEADPCCHWCGLPTVWWDAPGQGPPDAATLDHLRSRFEQPRARGNPPRPAVLACRSCNQARAYLEQALREMMAAWEAACEADASSVDTAGVVGLGQ